jgi:hypothetical protein
MEGKKMKEGRKMDEGKGMKKGRKKGRREGRKGRKGERNVHFHEGVVGQMQCVCKIVSLQVGSGEVGVRGENPVVIQFAQVSFPT